MIERIEKSLNPFLNQVFPYGNIEDSIELDGLGLNPFLNQVFPYFKTYKSNSHTTSGLNPFLNQVFPYKNSKRDKRKFGRDKVSIPS